MHRANSGSAATRVDVVLEAGASAMTFSVRAHSAGHPWPAGDPLSQAPSVPPKHRLAEPHRSPPTPSTGHPSPVRSERTAARAAGSRSLRVLRIVPDEHRRDRVELVVAESVQRRVPGCDPRQALRRSAGRVRGPAARGRLEASGAGGTMSAVGPLLDSASIRPRLDRSDPQCLRGMGDTGLEPVTSALSRQDDPDTEGQLRLW